MATTTLSGGPRPTTRPDAVDGSGACLVRQPSSGPSWTRASATGPRPATTIVVTGRRTVTTTSPETEVPLTPRAQRPAASGPSASTSAGVTSRVSTTAPSLTWLTRQT